MLLERIGQLYAIEKDIRGRSAEERRVVRQEKSRPIVDDLEPWLRAKLALISQKSKLAEAIRYALSRWDGLTRFLDDGRIEIDSNVVERTIRPIALNRKNALFAGSDVGGEHWADLAIRRHEMFVQHPPDDDPQLSDRQVSNMKEALQELEQQADQEQLDLLKMTSVDEIGNRVLRQEGVTA